MSKRARKKARWTVMVYLAGDNDLDSAGIADLTEMKRVGSSDALSIVAQFDRSGPGRSTNRYVLRKGTPLDADVVTALGETNMGDPAVLREFVAWAIEDHPADRYVLVLWNHGSGWDDSNLYTDTYFGGASPPVIRRGTLVARGPLPTLLAPVRTSTARAVARRGQRALFSSTVASMVTSRAIAFDDQAKDFLDSLELKRVLGDVARHLKRKIDVIGFDACLMSMLEVAYQVRNSANVICASEEEEPGDGWPYETVLRALAARPSMTPRELGRAIVERYIASYKPADRVTLSATDAAAVGPLAVAVHTMGRRLAHLCADASVRTALLAVRTQVQEYLAPYDDYCDLDDLCILLSRRIADPDLRRAIAVVRAALGKTVIASGAKGAQVAHSHGLAIYFPKKSVCRLYGTLDFSKRSGWTGFIETYTRRVIQRRR